jgi:hypothetical protein
LVSFGKPGVTGSNDLQFEMERVAHKRSRKTTCIYNQIVKQVNCLKLVLQQKVHLSLAKEVKNGDERRSDLVECKLLLETKLLNAKFVQKLFL